MSINFGDLNYTQTSGGNQAINYLLQSFCDCVESAPLITCNLVLDYVYHTTYPGKTSPPSPSLVSLVRKLSSQSNYF